MESPDYSVTFDPSPDWDFDMTKYRFQPNFHFEEDHSYAGLLLQNKKTGYQNGYLEFLDGGKEPWFRFFEAAEYCGVEMLFVTIQQDHAKYSAEVSPWLTTYIFRADTFEMIEEFSGTSLDVARFDSRWVPEVESYMPERYLVSCIPQGRGRQFSFGLIDRAGHARPPWCGPHGDKCRYRPPPYMEPWKLSPP